MTMDKQTQNFYNLHAREVAIFHYRAADGIERYFAQAFTAGGSVMDIGFGSGRDLKILLDAGYDAFGIDPCEEFIASALKYFANLSSRVKNDSLPALETVEKNSFDGVLCSAVLMHLPEELIFDSVYSIRRVLKENGRLLISIPVDSTLKGNRDTKGRLFNGVTAEKFRLIFERVGFRFINRWEDSDSLGRNHRRWVVILFTLESIDGLRYLA